MSFASESSGVSVECGEFLCVEKDGGDSWDVDWTENYALGGLTYYGLVTTAACCGTRELVVRRRESVINTLGRWSVGMLCVRA